MFNSGIPYSVPVTPYGTNGNGNGLFGGDSWAWIIVLLLLFGWGGNGGFGGFGGFGGGGYSEVQRGFDHNSVINKLDGLTYGLSDSTYALNNAITGGFHSVQSQLAECCCATQRAIDGVNYNMATQACDTRNVIQNSTRDILESNNANTRAILDFLTNDKISTLQAENQNLKLQASQAAQNAFITANQEAQTAELIRRLGADCPVPAYVVQPPLQVSFPVNSCGQFAGYGNYGGNCGCGCA
jgi:hypothetical protein